VSRAVSPEAADLTQCPRVPLVRFNLLVAGGVHRDEVRVSDDHFMAEGFEVAGDPLALNRSFDEDAGSRASASSKLALVVLMRRPINAPPSNAAVVVRRRNVTLRAEHELDCLASRIDRAVEIFPF